MKNLKAHSLDRKNWGEIGERGRADVLLVGEGADDGAEEHGGSEAGDEEAADVALVEAVLAVEVVDVGPLQPIPGCTTNPSKGIDSIHSQIYLSNLNQGREGGTALRTHHEGVDEDVVVLEGVEGGGGGDAVLAALAELEPRHDGGERAEDDVVVRLHGWWRCGATGLIKREMVGLARSLSASIYTAGDWIPGVVRASLL